VTSDSRTGKLKVGVIGSGWIGRQHAEMLSRRGDAEVVAVCDLDRRLAAEVAEKTGGEVYSDWREVLEKAPVEAVFVCTPPAAHAEPAIAALRQGVPLYLEKPIARDLKSAATIVAAASETSVVCAVGYQWHAVDALDDVRRVLDGRPVGCVIGESIGGTASRPWFIDRAQGGGNLLERGSHQIDLVRTVAGEVVSVQAASTSVRLSPRPPGAGDIDDGVTLLLHLAGGGLATIIVAWTSEDLPGSYWLQLVADRASLRLDLDPTFKLSGMSRGEPVTGGSGADPYEVSMGRFLQAARAGRPELVVCRPEDAARTLAVAVAAEAALATGGTVAVEAVPAGE
jgi:myo-inositol 2-dehydrogenase/D-chiro-inositol 1-dehydrogenase